MLTIIGLIGWGFFNWQLSTLVILIAVEVMLS